MSTYELVKQCYYIIKSLELLIYKLNFMEFELREKGIYLKYDSIENKSYKFIKNALEILSNEKNNLIKAFNQKNAVNIFYTLCSIQNTYKYFYNQNLSWSKLWDDGVHYKEILSLSLQLLQEQEIGIRLDELEVALVNCEEINYI